jgi:hypothetical protein
MIDVFSVWTPPGLIARACDPGAHLLMSMKFVSASMYCCVRSDKPARTAIVTRFGFCANRLPFLFYNINIHLHQNKSAHKEKPNQLSVSKQWSPTAMQQLVAANNLRQRNVRVDTRYQL